MAVTSGVFYRENAQTACEKLSEEVALFVVICRSADKTDIGAVIDGDSGRGVFLDKAFVSGVPNAFGHRIQHPV